MVFHQTANLRAAYARIGGDADTQLQFEAECERARAKQPTRHAVAPRQALTLHDHTRLGPGAVVTLAMFRADGEVPAWRQLENLVLRGVVLENYEISDEPDEDGAAGAPATSKAPGSRAPAGRASSGGSGAPSAA